MRSAYEQQLALECLKLAIDLDRDEPVATAEKFYEFVSGDAKPT